MIHFAVNVPYWDQWELPLVLEKSYNGTLAFSDFYHQHNEHRIVFPLLIMVGMARLTHWNVFWELALNMALALGIFGVFARQIRGTARALKMPSLYWTIATASLIVFSLRQYENWLWGWQLQVFLNVLAAMGAIAALSGPFCWGRFALAAMLGIVGTYSFANGGLVWPLGALVLLVCAEGRAGRRNAMLAWGAVAALTLGSYFWNYEKPAEHPPLSLLLAYPLQYLIYVCKYLGNIAVPYQANGPSDAGDIAMAMGAVGVVAFGAAIWLLLKRKVADLRTLMPYIGFGLYSICSALVTGVGRLGLGTEQALSSRYGTIGAPLWVSVVVLLWLLIKGAPAATGSAGGQQPKRGGPGGDETRMAARWALVAVMLMLALSSVSAWETAGRMAQVLNAGRAELLDWAAHPPVEQDLGRLAWLYPRPQKVVERYPILTRHRLSLFRGWPADRVKR